MLDDPIRSQGRSMLIGAIGAALVSMILAAGPNNSEPIEACLARKIQEARGEGLPVNAELYGAARQHSQEMAEKRDFFHDDLDNWRPESARAAGENVSMGSATCEEMHDDFMGSPKHRENILKSWWTEMVVAVAYDEGGTLYVTERFVQRRAAGRPQPAPTLAPAPPPVPPPPPAPQAPLRKPRPATSPCTCGQG